MLRWYEVSDLARSPSAEAFVNAAETETLALFEQLSFEFLAEFDVFAPTEMERTRKHESPELMRGFLQSYYYGTCGNCPIERELQTAFGWLGCGFDRPRLLIAVDHFFTDLQHVVDEGFVRLVEQTTAAACSILTYSIDSTDVRAMPTDSDASKCYVPTAKEYYYGYGCTIIFPDKRYRSQRRLPKSNRHRRDGDARHA